MTIQTNSGVTGGVPGHIPTPPSPHISDQSTRPTDSTPGHGQLAALCAIARFHQVAADPATLAHQLGLPDHSSIDTHDLLRAAQHLGLKARLVRTTPERLALMRTEGDALRTVLLAQSDGQRVLLQDPSQAGRPTIEPVDVFASQWTGQLILFTSRASLAGQLAKFDFSWFIPALVKYRKLLGEVLLISFMLQLFGLVSPLFFQVVMDKVLVQKTRPCWSKP